MYERSKATVSAALTERLAAGDEGDEFAVRSSPQFAAQQPRQPIYVPARSKCRMGWGERVIARRGASLLGRGKGHADGEWEETEGILTVLRTSPKSKK